ncbi:MAG: chromate transporter [Sulfobacillus sp.]
MFLKSLGSLLWHFLWVGALGFGGGFGMIPLMKTVTLSHHWLSVSEFNEAIAMGQITPGPVAISATFIGDRVAGTLGAVVATVGVFTPPVLLIVALTHWYTKLKKVPGVQNVLYATLAGVVGLIAGVTIMLGQSIIHNIIGGVFVAAALVAGRYKLPYWAIIMCAGLAGAVFLRGS